MSDSDVSGANDSQLLESDTSANNTEGGGKNSRNRARGVHFYGGSRGGGSCGQGSRIHRDGGGRRASHGRRCGRGCGHGGKI